VTLSADVRGDWITDFDAQDPGAFTLAAGASQVLVLKVTATNLVNTTRPDGLLSLSATITDAAGRTAADAADVVLVYGPVPVTPPPVVVPDTTARDATVGALVVLVPLLLAYAVVGSLYRVHAPESTQVRGGRGAWIYAKVQSRAPWNQTLQVRLDRPDGPWQLALDSDRIRVSPKEVAAVTVFARRIGDRAGPLACVAYLRFRRGAIYPWGRRVPVRLTSEPLDLTAWSSNSIQAAMGAAGMEIAEVQEPA